MKTLANHKFNGESALAEILRESEYKGIEQSIASLTLFTHPITVAPSQGKALFRIRRYKSGEERGQIVKDEQVLLCDNDSPTRTFLWANQMSHNQFAEVQFNHIYQISYDPRYYTSLSNICVTPAFLSKLTDKNDRIKALLKYRSYDLYGVYPDGFPTPTKPNGYEHLVWAETCTPNPNLKMVIESRLMANAKSRIAESVRNFGWLLN